MKHLPFIVFAVTVTLYTMGVYTGWVAWGRKGKRELGEGLEHTKTPP